MYLCSELEIIYISNLPSHMDFNLDEINHDGKKDITNHETSDASTANIKSNDINTSNTYGSLNRDGILQTNSTIPYQIIEERTPNEQIISLETGEDKRYRKRSLYISCATFFFFGMSEGMSNISTWPFMKKVCVKFRS